MNFHEYAPLARRTLKLMPTFRQHNIHMGLGVAGEFGELIDAAKKVAVYGKPYDHVNTTEEAGDVLWYIANLLPELMVDPGYAQTALDRGYAKGLQFQQKLDMSDPFNYPEVLLSLNKAVADMAANMGQLNPDGVPGSHYAVLVIETFVGNVGIICGLLGIDPSHAMQRNIEKLAKRYGDKYSDVAALNRDLGGERKVLEGTSEPEVETVANAIVRWSFDDLVAHGKAHYEAQGLPLSLTGMPWSFMVGQTPVTHESDDRYSVGGANFRRGDTLVLRDGMVWDIEPEAVPAAEHHPV